MSLHDITSLQWLLAVVAAFLVGVSKTGVSGLGLLAVALFANIIPGTKAASGLVLPLLITGDVLAFALYRQHAQWPHILRLAPWTGAGVVLGWWAMRALNDSVVKTLVGAIVVILIGIQWWRRRSASEAALDGRQHVVLAALIGVLTGFSTLVANAAGPLMAIYLLLMRLPKFEFMGTSAVFFMVLNWVKVPFMVNLGLINLNSLEINLRLVPAVVAGALLGKWILRHVGQKLFETLAIALSLLAGLKLLLW